MERPAEILFSVEQLKPLASSFESAPMGAEF
jgi:hypothetical protein